MAEERLQKILARAGLCSRRKCEELIQQGRVTVNGQVARLGMKADPLKDDIRVDGQRVRLVEEPVYIMVNKPRWVLSTMEPDPKHRTLRDLVPVPHRLFPVGRLDLESEGLVLLTNDGDLANRLMHPRYGHEKEYRVLVAKVPDEKQLKAFRYGIVLPDGTRTRPAQVEILKRQGKGAWLRIILTEGKKRQIREMCRTIGLPVVRLIRTRIGPLRLRNVGVGQWRYLTDKEVKALKRAAGLDSENGQQAARRAYLRRRREAS
ncbi:MAG: rRNA pseudouridine synthase [Chloroflexi bacterium]|nr:rRNA pseudouridine synthase [Chloroflexota bacterium]